MKLKTIIGLSLGIIGFILPFVINFDGLSFSGHLALSIFLMAAFFWMLEPIPIYSTSVLVILLGVLLLSAQGPLYINSQLPTVKAIPINQDTWEIPSSAITNKNQVYIITSKGETTLLDVVVLQKGNKLAQIQSNKIDSDSKLVLNAKHKLVGYKPVNYADYFNTLANSTIILFLGGLLLADIATKYNLDKNIARIILKPFGSNPTFIILGMLMVTGICSAFMSNTATTAMMMTVVLPIIAQLDPEDQLRKSIVLAIPIGANIGGIATPVGTPPNAVAIAALAKQGTAIPFGTWVLIAMPIAIIMLIVSWLLLIKIFPSNLKKFDINLQGKFDTSPKAIVLYVVAGITILMWMTEALHKIPSSIVAFFAVVMLTATQIADTSDIKRISWDVLWLVAGGIAMDISIKNTGLGSWLVSQIGWSSLGNFGIMFVFTLVALTMSEFLSNTVTATLLIPLAISVGISGIVGENFNLIMTVITIGISVSFAMALPISTPPNAIAVSTGMVKTKDMAKVGIIIGIIGLVLTLICAKFYWPLIIH